MINGVINIYKEAGYTSHDVVAKLRRILGQKKIGHTGTLDPDAEGVLPVCLGRATKLSDLLADHDKVYEAVLRLGIVTDTQDITGRMLSESPVTATEEEVRACIRSFLGEQMQVPPMYSARKVDGKKLYELARAGVVIERQPRRVVFYGIDVLEAALPAVRIRVHCSKGTYIRTLCHDIGAKLGCGGCLESLLRTRVGRFALKDAHRLSEVAAYAAEGRVETLVLPTDRMFSELPALRVEPAFDRAVHNGNPIPARRMENGRIRLYDSAGEFIGVYQKSGASYFPEKMFYDPGCGTAQDTKEEENTR